MNRTLQLLNDEKEIFERNNVKLDRIRRIK